MILKTIIILQIFIVHLYECAPNTATLQDLEELKNHTKAKLEQCITWAAENLDRCQAMQGRDHPSCVDSKRALDRLCDELPAEDGGPFARHGTIDLNRLLLLLKEAHELVDLNKVFLERCIFLTVELFECQKNHDLQDPLCLKTKRAFDIHSIEFSSQVVAALTDNRTIDRNRVLLPFEEAQEMLNKRERNLERCSSLIAELNVCQNENGGGDRPCLDIKKALDYRCIELSAAVEDSENDAIISPRNVFSATSNCWLNFKLKCIVPRNNIKKTVKKHFTERS